MPRILSALWFEEVGFLNEPLFDIPLGKISIRQTVIIGIAAVCAYFSFMFFYFLGLYNAIFVAGAILLAGMVFAFQGIKTLPPEKVILMALRKPDIGAAPRAEKGKLKKELAPGQLEKKGVSFLSADPANESPRKLVVRLTDDTGAPLPERKFVVLLNGREHAAAISDIDGYASVFFTPASYGVYQLELKPEGFSKPTSEVDITVEPRGGKK